MTSLQQEIGEALKNDATPFAIFDFDNTCIVNDIAEATLAYLCRNKLLKDLSLLGADDGSGDYHERVFRHYHELYTSGNIKGAYTFNARMYSGFTPEEAEAVTLAAIQAEGSEVGRAELYGITIARGLALRPQVIALLDFLKTVGVKIWVVSASPEVAVRTAMNHFGLDESLVAVKNVLENGVYTSALEEPRPVIEGKVECMRKFISADHSPLLVIDDSTTGLPILETAKIKVVVDRGNALATEARARGWYLL